MCTEIVSDIQNNFCTQHVLPMFCKKKSFWQRFTYITITISPIRVIISWQVFNLPFVKWILLRSFITKEKIREQMNPVWLFKNVQLKSVQSVDNCEVNTAKQRVLLNLICVTKVKLRKHLVHFQSVQSIQFQSTICVISWQVFNLPSVKWIRLRSFVYYNMCC